MGRVLTQVTDRKTAPSKRGTTRRHNKGGSFREKKKFAWPRFVGHIHLDLEGNY